MKTKTHLALALLVAFAALMAWGCGNELDEDHHATEPGSTYHPFEDPAVANHAEYLEQSGHDFAGCTECHGEDLAGVNTGPTSEPVRSCYQCHSGTANHPGDWTNAATGHSTTLREQNWDYEGCLVCHTATPPVEGSAVFGGSCSSANCHSAEAGGPDACNLCHGTFGVEDPLDPASWAPPFGLNDEIDPDDPAIGAHQMHMVTDTLYTQVQCNACHSVPTTVDATFHLDSSTPMQAEVNFHAPADAGGIAIYDREEGTCTVWCHQAATPSWTGIEGEYDCTSCHGMPPALHDDTWTDCERCHGDVVDAEGGIIARELHVNGTVEVEFTP